MTEQLVHAVEVDLISTAGEAKGVALLRFEFMTSTTWLPISQVICGCYHGKLHNHLQSAKTSKLTISDHQEGC